MTFDKQTQINAHIAAIRYAISIIELNGKENALRLLQESLANWEESGRRIK